MLSFQVSLQTSEAKVWPILMLTMNTWWEICRSKRFLVQNLHLYGKLVSINVVLVVQERCGKISRKLKPWDGDEKYQGSGFTAVTCYLLKRGKQHNENLIWQKSELLLFLLVERHWVNNSPDLYVQFALITCFYQC